MTNKEAIKELEEIGDNLIDDFTFAKGSYFEALDRAINALEEAQLDIKSLKMDLPELFRPSYDGGYLKEGEEE